QKLVDEVSASTDSEGNASFTVTTSQPVPVGETVTATALEVTGGNTSEFSAPKTVVAPDEVAPRVVRVVPAEDATGVAPAANVSAFFSEEMRSGTVNANTVKLRKAGTTQSLPATVGYDAATDKAILNPDANLQAGATYIATVTSGARDLAGNGLDQDPNASGNQQKVWKFKVR
ncbi:MAG: Ig-like domain-containing protein, partial [Rubrobacter sp.]